MQVIRRVIQILATLLPTLLFHNASHKAANSDIDTLLPTLLFHNATHKAANSDIGHLIANITIS
jgi:hypothetical protein